MYVCLYQILSIDTWHCTFNPLYSKDSCFLNAFYLIPKREDTVQRSVEQKKSRRSGRGPWLPRAQRKVPVSDPQSLCGCWSKLSSQNLRLGVRDRIWPPGRGPHGRAARASGDSTDVLDFSLLRCKVCGWRCGWRGLRAGPSWCSKFRGSWNSKSIQDMHGQMAEQ